MCWCKQPAEIQIFLFLRFQAKLFSQIKMVDLTTILLHSQIDFLMFPCLESTELKLHAEIERLLCMWSLELIYFDCLFIMHAINFFRGLFAFSL